MSSAIDEEDNNSLICIEKEGERCEEESDVDEISLTDLESTMEIQHCLLGVSSPSGRGDDSGTSQGSTGAIVKTGIYPTNSNRDSTSSIDAVALKSTPASPHVTALNGVTRIEYIAKHSSALESVSDIIGHHTSISGDIADSSMKAESSDSIEDVEVSKAQKFFNNMISTLSFKSFNTTTLSTEKRDRRYSGKRMRVSSDVGTESSRATVATIRAPSSADVASSSSLPPPKGPSLCLSESPLEPVEDGNNRNEYEKEKKAKCKETFANTNFPYAKEKRNDDFHKLFKSVAESERLIDDFSCALSREFLYQGRIYITSDHICFNSNLLGWVTNLVIAFADITSFQKTSTAGLFPNGIAVITKTEKHYFASFLSRDSTYEFMETVRQTYNAKLKLLAKAPFLDMQLSTQHHDDFFLKPINELMQVSSSDMKDSAVNGESNLEDAIMSVDYVTPCGTIKDTRDRGSINDYSEEVSDSEAEAASSDDEEDNSEKEGKHVFQLKEGTGFYYTGPHYLHETSFSYYPEEHGEYVLAELQLDAPPGVVFELLFSETNTSFIKGVLALQEGSQISHIPGFIEVNPDGQHFRKYKYTKALNFPVGPKSTKCLVQETVLHRDYKAYINVVNTTNTPDVPSGNSFCVKTRYMIRWASSTTSILKISFWVEWKGSSWIRSMVDKSCKSGQKQATKSLIKQIHEYLDKYVETRLISLEKAVECKQPEEVYVNKGFLSSRTSSPVKEIRSSVSSDGLSASSAISESLTAVPSSTSLNRFSWKYKILLILLVLISLLLFANLMFLVKLWSTMNYLRSTKESSNTCIGAKTLETLVKVVHSAVLDDMERQSTLGFSRN